MIIRVKMRLLLFAFLGFFAFVALTQWLSAPEPRPGPADRPMAMESGSQSAGRPAVDESPPDIDALDIVLLVYADGLAHTARRYRDSEKYETAALLFKRVLLIRNNILGPNHPSTTEAQLRYDELLRAQQDTSVDRAR